MNQVGFAQLADLGVAASQVGWKTMLTNMPSLKEVMREAKTGKMSTATARELEWIANPGTDWVRSMTHLPVDDFGNVQHAQGFWGRAEQATQYGTRVTSAISGMAPINAYIQRWAAKAALAKFVNAAEDGAPLNVARMRVLGLSEEEQKNVLKEIKKNRSYFKDEDTGKDVPTLNLDKWDAGTRHAFEYAMHTWTRKMIQENDLGQLNVVLGSTMGKLMFQFRMFMFGAYSKNTLHNMHMRDFESMSMIMGSTLLAGSTYAAQKYLQSIGRSDQEAFLEKELADKKIAAAAFSRAGYASLAPMLADVGTFALGLDPLFDTRVTGSPSQGLLSNPTMSLFDNALKASRGLTGAAFGTSEYSQPDARALQSTLPLGNFLPFVWMSNAMMGGLPEKRQKIN